MSLTLVTNNPIQPIFRLKLKRFVLGEERVIYAADRQEALQIIDSGL